MRTPARNFTLLTFLLLLILLFSGWTTGGTARGLPAPAALEEMTTSMSVLADQVSRGVDRLLSTSPELAAQARRGFLYGG